MLTLYYAPGSCSLASHLVLEEIGTAYRAHRVDLAKGDQRSAEFLRLNPKGKVPVLIDGDTAITENIAIQYHLVTTHPEAGLWPDDPAGRARWLSILSWLATSVQPDARHITRPENYTDEKSAHPGLQAKGRETTAKWMRMLDGMLSEGPWVLGARYSTADPYALVFAGVAERYGVPVGGYPHLIAWIRRMLQRPAVRRVVTLEDDVLERLASG
jgi:glutathione S-transferase